MPEYIFKTVYFPKDRVRAGSSARVSISLPMSRKAGVNDEMATYLKTLNSREFRQAIGNPFLEDLESQAEAENRSLSNICFSILKEKFGHGESNQTTPLGQLSLDLSESNRSSTASPGDAALGMTFRDNFRQGVHGWYPYVEGFSASYARDAILRDGKRPTAIYDPFGGAGTTQLTAASLSIPAFYSELNPFMSFVAETKVSSAPWASKNYKTFSRGANEFINRIQKQKIAARAANICLNDYHFAFPNRNFFEEKDIRELLAALEIANEIGEESPHLESILKLACVSNAVKCSNMTRRADLRRRRPDEYKTRVVDVSQSITTTIEKMIEDVGALPASMVPATRISEDAKSIPPDFVNAFDLILTSPPYLNGTNYFRNTKIELWLMSFIKSEKELRRFREIAITAGINDVSKRASYTKFESVESVAEKLDAESADKRIPQMVRHYFSDMFQMFTGSLNALVPRGKFLLDIGDSRFYGVHVPTDYLLTDVAKAAGFNVTDRHVLAKRRSRDKKELVQVELVFEKPTMTHNGFLNSTKPDDSCVTRISSFQENLPYKSHPYTKKSWGHKLHSLCSYQGKLKPALAYWLVREFVPPNGTILDPIGGVGTIPFEGALAGHDVVSNDKSPFAALIARAKLNPPTLPQIEAKLDRLNEEMKQVNLSNEDILSAEFGLNACVKDYYHEQTLIEVLKLRRIFLDQNPDQRSDSENFIWASLLHVLHGNRPYALSRTSHPITPFSPTGPTEYKCVTTKILERAQRALGQPLPDTFKRGRGIQGDFRELPSKVDNKFDAIITSPPFYGMRFDRPNWLRLWFCGWDATDFKTKSLDFLERQQTKDILVYKDFFESCRQMLKDNGLLILHLGSGGRKNLVDELREIGRSHFTIAGEVTENVQGITKHGLQDKGLTKSHSLLFLKPKP